MVSKDNFYISTLGTFIPVTEVPERQPDYKSYSRRYNTSSQYYYTDEGLYRVSDHWGRVARCQWKLNGIVNQVESCDVLPNTQIGFISWGDLELLN